QRHDALLEFFDRGHAAFASGAFGLVTCLRLGRAGATTGALAVASSPVSGVISSGPSCSSATGVAGVGSGTGSFRRLAAIAAYSGLLSQAMKWRFICWQATAVVPLPTKGS